MNRYNSKDFLESADFPFSVIRPTLLAEEVHHSHSHEFIELIYVLEGQAMHTYRGSSYPISKGDVFIIEPEIEHSYQVEAGSYLKIYILCFQPQILKTEIEKMSKKSLFSDSFYLEPFFRKTVDFQSKLTLHTHEQIKHLYIIDSIYEEFHQKMMGYRYLIQTKLMELFIYLRRHFQEHTAMNPIIDSVSEGKIIERVCSYIEKYHSQPLSLQQVSQICGMSQSTFTTKFKDYTGCTFLEYRNKIRLRIAKELLATTSHKIITIAQEVGFDDVSNFNKMFKQLEGISPNQYRKIKMR